MPRLNPLEECRLWSGQDTYQINAESNGSIQTTKWQTFKTGKQDKLRQNGWKNDLVSGGHGQAGSWRGQ